MIFGRKHNKALIKYIKDLEERLKVVNRWTLYIPDDNPLDESYITMWGHAPSAGDIVTIKGHPPIDGRYVVDSVSHTVKMGDLDNPLNWTDVRVLPLPPLPPK